MNSTRASRPTFLRGWFLWTAGFAVLPLAGWIGTLAVGRIDNPAAALAGGAIAGLILGTGQVLVSSHRIHASTWIPATVLGMGAGLALGSAVTGYRTSLADLMLMGALNGLVLGTAQALALPRGTRNRWAWAGTLPALWALGWTVTTLIGVGVGAQFIVFGSSGALVFAAVSGLLLHRLLPHRPANRPATGPLLTAKVGV